MNTDIFVPMPPMETLESRIARQVARDYARNPLFRQCDMYDPRQNVPGVTYWGIEMPTITIKHRDTEAVLFTHEVTDEQQSSGIAVHT